MSIRPPHHNRLHLWHRVTGSGCWACHSRVKQDASSVSRAYPPPFFTDDMKRAEGSVQKAQAASLVTHYRCGCDDSCVLRATGVGQLHSRVKQIRFKRESSGMSTAATGQALRCISLPTSVRFIALVFRGTFPPPSAKASSEFFPPN